jgi:hypothetical protein
MGGDRLMDLAADMRDYLRRLGISAAADIPCVATSNTEAQARTVILKDRLWAMFILLAVAVVLLLGVAKHPSAENWLRAGGMFAGIVALSIFIGRKTKPDLRNYRDPHIRIEIGPDEVVAIGPAGRDAQPYAALASLMMLSRPGTRSPSFDGIGLQTKLGYIVLTNDYYQSGMRTAGAILKRMDELGVPLRPFS